jgi:hypothetical protein
MKIRRIGDMQGKLTFDCAKATLETGTIDIDDVHFGSTEIQGALKMGMIEIVGQMPALSNEQRSTDGRFPANGGQPQEEQIKFRNTYDFKLCFDCIKKYVAPGETIMIPISKIDDAEISNAISSGWLLDEDNPAAVPFHPSGTPVVLDEVSVVEDAAKPVVQVPAPAAPTAKAAKTKPAAQAVPRSRPRPKASPVKAKQITASGGRDSMDLDTPSEILDLSSPSSARTQSRPAAQKKDVLVYRDKELSIETESPSEVIDPKPAEEALKPVPAPQPVVTQAPAPAPKKPFEFKDIFGDA